MSQQFVYIMAPDDQEVALSRSLRELGFEVTPSRRMTGGINVRVRRDTDDEAEVQRVVDQIAPDARRGPSGSPTHTLVGYRQ